MEKFNERTKPLFSVTYYDSCEQATVVKGFNDFSLYLEEMRTCYFSANRNLLCVQSFCEDDSILNYVDEENKKK